jgi:hypothetical protein
VLKPGGDLAIFDFSGRSSPDADREDLVRLAESHNFEVIVNGAHPFPAWDTLAFHLRKLS